jgi:hypothetical protein
MVVKKLLIALATTVALVGPAAAKTYTYTCYVPGTFKKYPVTLTTPHEEQDDLSGGTITWQGKTYRNVKWIEECHAKFTATRNGVTIELCTMTHGFAELGVGKEGYDCEDSHVRD